MTESEESTGIDFATKERAMDEAPVGITVTDPDAEDNPLVYVNEAFERVTGYPAAEVLGRNCRLLQGPETEEEPVAALRDAVNTGEPVTVELLNYRQDGERFWNEVTIAPLRDDDGEVTNFVGFQDDVTRRKEAEIALREERARLDRLLDRVDGLLEAVTEAIVMTTARDDLERSICDRLVAMEGYEAAWIGERDPASEAIVPSAWSPDDAQGGVESPGRVSTDGDHPAAVATRTGTVQFADERGRDEADIAVPLQYRDATYGVLVVTARHDAFDEREVTVFTALGRAIGAAMSVLESRRIITADTVVEVELQLTDPSLFFVHFSAAADCRLDYAGSVVNPGGEALFFTVAGADGAAIEAAAADHEDVASVTILAETDDGCRIEVEPAADSIVGRLAESGARTQDLFAEDGRATLSMSLPEGADVRAVYERVRDRHPGTSLLSTTQRTRAPETRGEYIERIEDRLTERQRTALRTAYAAGYFDRPRHVTGDDLAEAMGVGRSTFHQHLRAGERKLLAAFFER